MFLYILFSYIQEIHRTLRGRITGVCVCVCARARVNVCISNYRFHKKKLFKIVQHIVPNVLTKLVFYSLFEISIYEQSADNQNTQTSMLHVLTKQTASSLCFDVTFRSVNDTETETLDV